MAIMRLAHVCIRVRNFKRTYEFYQRLGLRPVFKFTRKGRDYGMYMEIAEGQYIEFFEEPDAVVDGQAALAHFCLETENLDLLIEEFKTKGISHTPLKLGPDNTYQIWISDPDGISFEIHQYTDRSAQLSGGPDVEADW